MVLAGMALSHYVHPNWLALPIFVGLNLAQSGISALLSAGIDSEEKAGVPETK